MNPATINTTTMTIRTATELVDAARRHDAGAYDELIHRYERYVWSVVHSYRISEADRNDVVQVTWLRLVENLDRLRDPERLGGWLATTASRECLRVIRRKGQENDDGQDQLAEQPDQLFPAPEQHAITEQMACELWEQVASLPARGQMLLRALSAPDPPAYAELARRTGMRVGSIGPTRGRYLHQLRERLEKAGLGRDTWR